MQLVLRVEGRPVAQPRQQFSPVVNRKTGELVRGANGRPVMGNFIPSRVVGGVKQPHLIHAYKAAILAAFRDAVDRARKACVVAFDEFPLQTPVELRARWSFAPMKTVRWGAHWNGVEPISCAEDVDNLEKAVMDALTKPRKEEHDRRDPFGIVERHFLLADDRFVWRVVKEKVAAQDGIERAEIVFRWGV